MPNHKAFINCIQRNRSAIYPTFFRLPMDRCEHCKKPSKTLQICTHCEKVAYCNKSHRAAHQIQHKVDCYPAVVHSEDNCGRYWVATRDVLKGELLFSENALVFGPSTECGSPLYPTCLGCCRRTNLTYACRKCHWPVCNKKCEKVSHHAEFECKVFRKNKVHSSTRPQYYLYIQLLRALLLEKTKPTLFQKLMKLEPHSECRRNHNEEYQMTKSFYRFVTEDCNLKYDFDLVDHVVGVNRINSYSADIMDSAARARSSTALFCQMSLLNHDCLPNTRSVIHENPYDFSLHMKLYASTDIWKGECITQQYVPVVKGTIARRKALKEWFFDCSCHRCCDPTEFRTYFSCIKCTKCNIGFLTPDDPLKDETSFRCSRVQDCGNTGSFEEVQNIIKPFEEQIKEHETASTGALNCLLKKVLLEKAFHPQHYVAVNLQYEVVQRVVKGLNNEKDFEIIPQCIQYCRNILKVVNILCPGYSYYRGVILYFLGNLLYTLYEEWNNENPAISTKEQNRLVSVQEMLQVIQEGAIIMSVEPDESIYREMADELKSFEASIKSCYS